MRRWGPQGKNDYFHIGPVFLYRPLAVLLAALCAALVCLCGGSAVRYAKARLSPQPYPVFAYDAKALGGFTGTGRIRDARGVIRYEGAIADGLCTGEGVVYDGAGQMVFSGTLAQNEYQYGAAYQNGVLRYRGAFQNSVYEGEGTLYRADGGTEYEGGFYAGRRQGHGVAYRQSGGVLYEGAFEAGLYHGIGTLYEENGRPAYAGEFRRGAPEGEGVFYGAEGQPLYEGRVRAGRPDYLSFLGGSVADALAALQTPCEIYTAKDKTAFCSRALNVLFLTEDAPVFQRKAAQWPGTASGESVELDPETQTDQMTVTEVLLLSDSLPELCQGLTTRGDIEAALREAGCESAWEKNTLPDERDFFAGYALPYERQHVLRELNDKTERAGDHVVKFTDVPPTKTAARAARLTFEQGGIRYVYSFLGDSAEYLYSGARLVIKQAEPPHPGKSK